VTAPLLIAVLVLGLVQGVTEFLPISSSGHLILAGRMIDFEQAIGGEAKGVVFEIFIQAGSIAAILAEYGRELWKTALTAIQPKSGKPHLLIGLVIGTVPVVLVGGIFGGEIQEHLFNPTVVAWAFIFGGIIMWVVESLPIKHSCSDTHMISWRQSLFIGLAQVLALVPGTSRSGATIMGGLCSGLDRRTATEFSFLLALPVLLAATTYTLLKHAALLDSQMLTLLMGGFLVSFLCSWAVIRWLIRYVRSHSFKVFAAYRIAFGAAMLYVFRH
jgi:undecaprenyl-diphosphatase